MSPATRISTTRLSSRIARVSKRNFSVLVDNFTHQAESRIVQVRGIGPDNTAALKFYAPNAVCRYRANTFSVKEPETIAWLDEFSDAGTLYDIGANVGLYSVYFSAIHKQEVYAFEPSALNLMLLAKNISLNNVESRVVIIANPLTSVNSVAEFNLSSLEAGGAMSTFGETYGHDGKELNIELSYRTLGFSLDSLAKLGLLSSPPGLMKIDVDGIEHLVLAGATDVLKLTSLKSILIEVNDEFDLMRDSVHQLLTDAGFTLRGKFHGELVAKGAFNASFNQIWDRA